MFNLKEISMIKRDNYHDWGNHKVTWMPSFSPKVRLLKISYLSINNPQRATL